MTYEQQILSVLARAGEHGIGVQAIAKHVYNMNATLFEAPDYGEVLAYVRRYVARNSRSPRTLIERTGRWGYYRLNGKLPEVRQMSLQFGNVANEVADAGDSDVKQQDLSLDLFASLD